MKEMDLIGLVVKIEKEYVYDEDIVLSKFIKKYGEGYSQEEFLQFLKRRKSILMRAVWKEILFILEI